jgi:hypothetical protein
MSVPGRAAGQPHGRGPHLLEGRDLLSLRPEGPAHGPRQGGQLRLPGAEEQPQPGVHGRQQSREVLRAARGRCRRWRRHERAAVELLTPGCASRSERPGRRVPPPAVRRHAPARDDRHRGRLRAEGPRRGRADDRPRRHDPGRRPRHPARPARRVGHGDRAHHARPRCRRRSRRQGGRHVRRPAGGAGGGPRAVRPPAAPLQQRTARSGSHREQGVELVAGRRLSEIPGLVPALRADPDECVFAPRCSRRTDVCVSRRPPLEPVRPGHPVACFHPGRESA